MTVHKKASVSSEPPSSANRKDSTFYWDTVCFSAEDILFKLPRHQFVLGSYYFEQKYLRGSSDTENATSVNGTMSDLGPIVKLEDVTAQEFRVFLKILFPVHSASTILTLNKGEWLTVLALATRWHFLDFRRLAIQHLGPQLIDPIELVRVGRSTYVPKWVMKGYQALVSKHDAISEEESKAIGHYTTVKLYIIRHVLRSPPEGPSDTTLTVIEHLLAKFVDEWDDLARGEAKCCTGRDAEWDRDQVDEVRRLKDELEKQRQIVKAAEEEARLKEEEAQRTKELVEEGKPEPERWTKEERKLNELVEIGKQQLTEEKKLRTEEEGRLKRRVETGKTKLAEERSRLLHEVERLQLERNEQERRWREDKALAEGYKRQMQQAIENHQHKEAQHNERESRYLEEIRSLNTMYGTKTKELKQYKQLEKAQSVENERLKAEVDAQRGRRSVAMGRY